MEITKENILKAISIIDNKPSLLKGRASSTYDLVFNGKKYPPILVLSEANQINEGKELFLEDFGNAIKVPFEILKREGFVVSSKRQRRCRYL
jgi:5-methylcytosine-specific restriction protein B